jgi:hypothetical protein
MKKYSWIVAVFMLVIATLACALPDLSGKHLYVTLKPDTNQTLDAPTLKRIGDSIWKRLNLNGINSSYTPSNGDLLFTLPAGTDLEKITPLLKDKGEISFVDSTQPFTPGSTVDPSLPVILTNADIKSASVETNSSVPGYLIAITFTPEGSKKMADYTSKNVGHCLVIARDSSVISSPVVNSAITDGQAVIQGSFTQETANALAAIMRSESLPYPMIIVETSTK